ncbi:MAG: hypothetical protein J0H06_10075 [Actinobacteria bacterium]|nr:hypothetical protein [Actinomycetota bacterium]OJU84846.1 MAG: hypothetical protein BGO11_08580 [Solirubrobacterales bacterium 70-9]
MKTSRKPVIVSLVAVALLAFAASAQAATLTLKCSGKGPQSKAQEYSTAECTVAAGQKRNIEGVLRNDKNKPVAATLNVTFSKWIPQGEGSFAITPEKTIEIKSAANGKFKVPNVTTTTEETVFIEAIGDSDAELSPVSQEVNIQRYVTATAKKLGGGKVKVTVTGAATPFKIGITEEEGYFVSGGTARKASKAGTAVFNLGSQRGTFNIYIDAGELGDLYYFDPKSFKL